MEAFHPSLTFPFSYTFNTTTSALGGGIAENIATSCPNPWMDARIWCKLPHRLLDRVIAFLPPPAFFRARCVCKRWYALLFSDTFLQLYLEVSQRRHWFLFFKNKSLRGSYIYRNKNIGGSNGDSNTGGTNCEGYLFDPYELSWYRLSFALLPSGFSPTSSSGGLICWVSDEAGPKTLILCNPIVGSMSPLPPTLRPRLLPSIGLSVNPTSIDVTVAGDDLISPYAVKNLTAESFHIDAGGFFSLWGINSSLPKLCNFESGQMVNVRGRFYCMNYGPYSVLAYDVAANNCWTIEAPMRRALRSPTLMESSGKLLLVSAVEKSKLNVPKSLRIWGLQACGTTWVEMERMPQQLYVQFDDLENGNGYRCVGHGEFITIMILGSDKALLFDMSRKRWQWIPPCPYVHAGVDGDLHGFAYEPWLATPVTGLLDQLTTIPFQAFSA
ncbi:protein UNUSUAL FLORAL ORGANS-like [Pyrus ussuriensis x Pyrus communis]|uniref:Protein UNUSUAL FLORAL ORGANS-like n=1 Tax=Pyrus ussuriensis x Pyrus communis TaxID=2448454 RepID=A0A5N5FKE2_9ROSA|nr:protein UNUSUAL FLORAL ORGANS-like [Pyrus ussuriensis x Pyrus communis]